MDKMIVESPIFLTLLGGGFVAPGGLNLALKYAPILVAADGGAANALAQEIVPQAVIGDFDSLDPSVRHRLPSECLHLVTEQDSTDFEKALRRVQAPLILGVGLTGKRRDHELAALHALLRYPDKPCILLAESDVICLCPPRLTLDLPVGTRMSLFPMAPVEGTSTGLRWKIDGLRFAPGAQIGTSNQTVHKKVAVTMSAPAMLLILPLAHLANLIAAMSDDIAGWPIRDCG